MKILDQGIISDIGYIITGESGYSDLTYLVLDINKIPITVMYFSTSPIAMNPNGFNIKTYNSKIFNISRLEYSSAIIERENLATRMVRLLYSKGYTLGDTMPILANLFDEEKVKEALAYLDNQGRKDESHYTRALDYLLNHIDELYNFNHPPLDKGVFKRIKSRFFNKKTLNRCKDMKFKLENQTPETITISVRYEDIVVILDFPLLIRDDSRIYSSKVQLLSETVPDDLILEKVLRATAEWVNDNFGDQFYRKNSANYIVIELKKAIDEQGITMYRLAKATGVTRQLLSLYFNHEVQPSLENITKICKALGFSLSLTKNEA